MNRKQLRVIRAYVRKHALESAWRHALVCVNLKISLLYRSLIKEKNENAKHKITSQFTDFTLKQIEVFIFHSKNYNMY